MYISKAIIPAAGFGTRFLPLTKAIPKELIPLINKPVLQEVIEEGIQANIHDFYIITNKQKQAINNYFSRNGMLEKLAASKATLQEAMQPIQTIIATNTFHYLYQQEMKGLGDAILQAQKTIHDEPFAVLLPDDLIFHTEGAIQQLITIAQRYKATVVAVMEVPMDQISAYGSIQPGNMIEQDVIEILNVIEKPEPEQAFSNLGIIGRYIFTPSIFHAIEAIAPHAKGEIQLTDAITHLAQKGEPVLAYKIKGTRFDTGRPVGWLAANMYQALAHPVYGTQLRTIITNMLNTKT